MTFISFKKIKKRTRFIIGLFLLSVLIISAGLIISEAIIESKAHIAPEYLEKDLRPILEKDSLSDNDYKILFYQTGLGMTAINEIIEVSPDPVDEIISFQKNFFKTISISCEKNSIISKQESVTDNNGYKKHGTELTHLKDGYILITNASHVFGWRNGHAAIVVNGKERLTLESVVLGTNSSIQNADDWNSYPNFMILKLKDASDDLSAEIARNSLERLNDIPYNFMVGLTSSKFKAENDIKGTQCSHLVWHAFKSYGFDLDSDGGRIVTPKDIANSPLLEIVQVYGVDPSEIWP